VIAVNDRSTDRTGAIIDDVAASSEAHGCLRRSHSDLHRVGSAKPTPCGRRPAGNWAWLLFTDADVQFKPDALRRAVAYAETERADHVVLFRE